jgi:TonB family protein
MGKPKAPKKPKVYALKGPRNNPDPHLARHLAQKEALNTGLVRWLGTQRGGAIASIFSEHETAMGQDTLTALGGLIGDTTGESLGVGGLGLSGTGRGGGHTGVGIGLGPLGTIGKGGLGKDGIHYGSGVKLPDRGRKPRAPRMAGRAKILRGALDKAIIRRVVRQHLNQIRYCYQRELQTSDDLRGRVVVRFTIAPSGQVVASVVGSSTLNHAGVETCVTRAVRRWLFPKPRDGGIVQVDYPFVFHPVGSR